MQNSQISLREPIFGTMPVNEFPAANGNTQARVLLLTDEPEMAAIWAYTLSQMQLEVRLMSLSEAIMEAWASFIPDLVIIEDFNEEVEELDVCRSLRALTIVPMLYFTTKLSESYHLQVYGAGADDCIAYPITPRLFQAKVNAWLRRTRSLPLAAVDPVQASGFTLHPEYRQVSLPSGGCVRLTVLETRLLYLLMSHAGQPLPKRDLIERVWGHHTSIDQRLLKNHIYRLRQKIEPDPTRPRYLLSSGYTGFKFQP
jgi:DNA-binding response OmpR family regulator